MQRSLVLSTHTIRLHRVLRTTPDKLYRAFLDGDAMCKWLPLSRTTEEPASPSQFR